ncbi:cytochrome ubiquinol oxidase subunit I [Cellulomonas marina]|uniref:Cytochrome d ubiquinol oxidase subunit I n=1 Tax=Cellulomonas marina TaxID=988821 RepID=A0A1I0YPD4_9CELL|nr:cytochrome ubiquinol oxidase subunit I [Cellulomonas marina]GIG27590.1 putative integral membrane cytochrome D ubiquinol oxidase (Subunit I) CydA [Cellulomonas marina]SFB15255.1 cytochrome d ubiquinol oxidase subunit I [Cellulomonas marina]
MDALTLARWQFGVTTVYHFVFVPLTIGLSPLVAVMQTAWVRTGDVRWLKLTKFFGKLLLINFAIGVATGIVQEFQFGLNWSEYSRFVGDVFGAPLAMEALAAFFVESTFLGLWIFGWDRLPRRVHLATIWAVALATNLSAFFILAANSWMQHPVGAELDPETGRAQMTSILAVLTNPTVLAAFPHTISASLLTAATFVAAICSLWLVRSHRRGDGVATTGVYRSGLRLGVGVMIGAAVVVGASGHWQGQLMFEQQPMKMASAEGLCATESGVPFSLLAVGDLSNDCEDVTHLLQIPGMTSFLADNSFSAELQGVDELQAEYEARYGAGIDYRPDLAVTYWSFRLMIGMAAFAGLLAVAALWLTRGGRVPTARWFRWSAIAALPTIFLASSFGWIFTEMGRQPWVVAPNPTGIDDIWLLVERGVSTQVPASAILTSMVLFTLLYGVLAVFWYRLMHRYAVEGVEADPVDPSPDARRADVDDDADRPLSFAY